MLVITWRKRSPHALLLGMYMSAVTVAISVEVPLKTRSELPYVPSITQVVLHLKEFT
jgi:hypothetical protein